MDTGLQVDVKGGLSCLEARSVKGNPLGMGFSGFRMVPFSDHPPILHKDGAHQRVGRRPPPSLLSQTENPLHPSNVIHHRIRKIRNPNIEMEFNAYPDIRLSGSGYQNIRVLSLVIFHSLIFPDILIPGILLPDFLVT
jgi:hypothetical protein